MSDHLHITAAGPQFTLSVRICVAELLSEVVFVLKSDFEVQFRSLWPLLAAVVKTKPSPSLRVSLLGLAARVSRPLLRTADVARLFVTCARARG